MSNLSINLTSSEYESIIQKAMVDLDERLEDWYANLSSQFITRYYGREGRITKFQDKLHTSMNATFHQLLRKHLDIVAAHIPQKNLLFKIAFRCLHIDIESIQRRITASHAWFEYKFDITVFISNLKKYDDAALYYSMINDMRKTIDPVTHQKMYYDIASRSSHKLEYQQPFGLTLEEEISLKQRTKVAELEFCNPIVSIQNQINKLTHFKF